MRKKFGHINYNKVTDNNIANIFNKLNNNRALASIIDACIMDQYITCKPTMSTLSVSSLYKPSIHYPSTLF